jgi:D-3-phosphoglycerate dehydrogenase
MESACKSMKALKDCHVLVTPTSFGRSDPELITELEETVGHVTYNTSGKPLSSNQLAELLADVDGYIAGLDLIDRQALEKAAHLKVIARYGMGTDRIDLDAAAEKGIIVTNTPGANAVAVAELTLALLLNLARPVMYAASQTREGQWPRTKGYSLQNKTIGLIGLGTIGKQVARRLSGFDCRVLAYDPVADEAFAAEFDILLTNMDDLLRMSDFVSLHVPVLTQTKEMVDADFLSKMKSGAFLINTSRGELIDEKALYDALVSGKLSGAAMDAFKQEPPGKDNPLLALPQVIPTPHMGAHADSATNAMGSMALANCLAVLRGQEPINRVN